MASNPPGQCCTIGVTHEGQPKGELKQIGGNEYYVATASGNNVHKEKAIVLLTEVYGHTFPNSQLIADQFAANGYTTYIPDIFFGDAYPLPRNRPEGFPDVFKWLTGVCNESKTLHDPANTDHLVLNAIKHLREVLGFKKVGAVGYCFGAKYTVRHLDGKGGFDVGYNAHPSFVDRSELEKIKGPLSIAAAETDDIFTVELRHESEDILKGTGVPWQINLFGGVEHGFAARGDVSQPQVKYAKEQAFYQAVQWFDRWL